MKKTVEMKIVNSMAAGIDVGSRIHYAAVGQNPDDVRSFGVYTQDHQAMVEWFRQKNITTIAMESTGSYWQTLFAALQAAGFEVLLVQGAQIKNVKGKTDVMDCQWIQRLHSLALLSGSFLPQEHVARIRVYYRHRLSLTQEAAKMTNKMQKALRLMNVRLDVAISDIMGASGKRIIEAILGGERDGKTLAGLADCKVKKSKEEICCAMQGHWQEEYLYELKDCYDLYNIFGKKIRACDDEMEKLLKKHTVEDENPTAKLTHKKHRKNQIAFDLSLLSYKYTGVDLFAVEGMSHNTIMAFLAEVGEDIKKFQTAKQFARWLRLSPNNKKTGGNIISSRTPKGKNKFAHALMQAANSVAQLKKGALVSFFKRIAYKKGRGAAVVATARKLAVIIWNMIVRQEQYRPLNEQTYNEKIKLQVVKNMRHKMKRMGISVNELAGC